ncbi:hypothetical protein B0H19DRAFT_1373193 [Mycena capillaripes]|nr:hypothetical protein B0H19DRAFT_1373193 [Mycena capillaripes]
MTPTRAGTPKYPSSSRGSGPRPNHNPPAGNPGYPYQPRSDPAKLPAGSAHWGDYQPPTQPQYSSGSYPPVQAGFAPMQYPSGGTIQQQYYNASTVPTPPHYLPTGSGSSHPAYYDQNQNYDQSYVSQPNRPWPQRLECICPPGPCFCGARFDY